MAKTGRPPIAPGARRHSVGVSLDDREVEALRSLARWTKKSQGSIVGRLVLEEWAKEKAARRKGKDE